MKFGFTSTTLRNIKSIEKIVEIAKQANADCIEWGGDVHIRDIKTAEKAAFLCKEAKIEISSYASYYKVGYSEPSSWEEICKIAQRLGAKSVRVWLGKKDSEITDDKEYKKIVEDTKRICEIANNYSLLVCPECHDNTFNNNTDAFLKIRESVEYENFRTYFQSRYKKLEYDLDRIERTIEYTENVHISFSELRREQFPSYNPEYMDKLLKKLIDCKYDGLLLLEYTYIFGRFGLPSCLIKDIDALRRKVDEFR